LKKIKILLHDLSLISKVTLVSVVTIASLGATSFAIQSSLKTAEAQKDIEQPQIKETELKSKNTIDLVESYKEEPVESSSTPSVTAPEPTTNNPVYTPPAEPEPTTNNQVYIPPAPKCNQELADSYLNLRDVYLNAENITYANNLQSIRNEASSRGISFSGYFDAMRPPEDARHTARVAEINNQYLVNMTMTNC